jgi:hypothetical protein
MWVVTSKSMWALRSWAFSCLNCNKPSLSITIDLSTHTIPNNKTNNTFLPLTIHLVVPSPGYYKHACECLGMCFHVTSMRPVCIYAYVYITVAAVYLVLASNMRNSVESSSRSLSVASNNRLSSRNSADLVRLELSNSS